MSADETGAEETGEDVTGAGRSGADETGADGKGAREGALNPLIVPPPPPGAPPKAPAVPEVDRPPTDRTGFISMPPSVFDSATHRIAAARIDRRPERAAESEIVFHPVAPGAAVPNAAAPPASSAPAPVAPPIPPVPAAAAPPAPLTPAAPTVAPPTTQAPTTQAPTTQAPTTQAPTTQAPTTTTTPTPTPTAPASWRLVLPTGEEVELTASALLGRNPQAVASAPGARLLQVTDPAKSVSKTHALLEVDGEAVWVHDLASTNGVFIVEPGREVVEVRPGHRVRLSGAGDLELGEFVIQVRRG